MSGTVKALIKLHDGETEIVSGSRLAFSPFRLFQIPFNELPQTFCNKVRQKLESFDLVITDVKGRDFFLKCGVHDSKVLICEELLITADEKNSIQDRISNLLSENQCRVLNAMSRYSDRIMIKNIGICHPDLSVEDFSELNDLDLNEIPKEAWISLQNNIYPMDVPLIDIKKNLDFLVMDCPARNLSLLPNGVAYLENALKKNRINFQVLDLDVIAYHLFHMHRIFDVGRTLEIAGIELPEDPWLAHNYDVWSSFSEHESRDDEESTLPIHRFFDFLVKKAAEIIAKASPSILGFSVQQCNEVMTSRTIKMIRDNGLKSPVIVGGFSCYNFDIGLRGFPLAEYMCIGEAETTIAILIQTILKDGQAKDIAGVLSIHDSPGRSFSPAPMIHNLDTIEFPKYSWTDLKEYVNWDGYQLVPIIASRGCRWSRCTFCAERFYWRIRSAKDFVDELEWHVLKGHYLFMFNESDLNGMPERVLEICDEIIRRGLHKKVKLTGQLRIHRKSDSAFFLKLRAAGFVALRFGVDSFSRNGMKLQQKGYTPEIVAQNLRDCSNAGIFVEVNWVIGVPGETENDIDEGIEFILKNQKYIGRLANLNPLILVNGSVYWLNPSDYDLHFKEPWEELKAKFPRAIPAGLWWSENPLIDSSVRQYWFQKVVRELYISGFPIGDWAKQVIEDVELRKDGVRSDGSKVIEEVASSDLNLTSNSQQTLPVLELSSDSLAKPPNTKNFERIDSYNGYALYFSENIFYAIHESVSTNESNLDSIAIFKASKITSLQKMIDDALTWANSRGAYPETDKSNIMRADSNLARPQIVPEIENSLENLLRVNNNTFLGVDLSQSFQDTFDSKIILNRLERILRKINKRKSLKIFKETIGRFFFSKIVLNADRVVEVELFSKGATPELVASWDDERINIVRFDNFFYVVPHGLSINFENLEKSALQIQKFTRSKNLGDLYEKLELGLRNKPSHEVKSQGSLASGEIFNLPKLVKTMDDHNIVGYEGFYYAIPHSLGEVKLDKMDAVEDVRIFKDVSLYAVEDYVMNKTSTQNA